MDELGHSIDGQEHEEFALGEAQLADVDVDVADGGFGEALSLGRRFLVLGQPGDAMTLKASVNGAPRERWDGVLEAAEDIVEREQGAAAKLDDDCPLGLGEDGAARSARSHRRIGAAGSGAPFGDGLGVQPLLGHEGPGACLRRLELGSNTRRCSGAAGEELLP